jgi:hypothetical protein
MGGGSIAAAMCLAAVAWLVAVLLALLQPWWWQQVVNQMLHLAHAILPYLVPSWQQHQGLSDSAATCCGGCAIRPAAWGRRLRNQPLCTTLFVCSK